MATGLDTRGLASGFAQGFGLADQHFARQAQGERADERLAMQRERFDMQREEVERARDLETVQLALGKIASGMDLSEAEIQTLRDNPKYWPALDPDTDDALAVAEQVVDPESPTSINEPQALASLNQLFGAEINKGEGGRKLVTGVYPGTDPESVTLDLEVTGEDGTTYRAPMTEGRSAREDDDAVKEVPVERLTEQAQGLKALRQAFQTPEAQQQAAQVLRLLRGDTESWEMEEHPTLGMIQRNTATGEVKPIRGGAGSADARNRYSGRDRRPSRIREAELLVKNGIAGDMEEAYAMVRQRAGEGQRQDLSYIDFLNDELDRLDDQLDRYGLEEDERERLRRRRDDLAQELDQASRRTFDRPAPAPDDSGDDRGSDRGSGEVNGGDDVIQSFREKFGY